MFYPERRTVVVHLKGGLGNQLFMYAAGRRLAFMNGMDLAIDLRTGFARDHVYSRSYALGDFPLAARTATKVERLGRALHVARRLVRTTGSLQKLAGSWLLLDDAEDFNPQILQLKPHRTVHLDGYWQSPRYFSGVESLLQEELRLASSTWARSASLASEIRGSNSVAVHIRSFGSTAGNQTKDVSRDYYLEALKAVHSFEEKPTLWVFAPSAQVAREILGDPVLRAARLILPSRDRSDAHDLWLMSRARHLVMANSTFSWWAGWLGRSGEGRVYMPWHPGGPGSRAWNDSAMQLDGWTRIGTR